MSMRAMPEPTMIDCNAIVSATGPNSAMPRGRKPEYMVPNRPNTLPCMALSVFSCNKVVIAVCTIVIATP